MTELRQIPNVGAQTEQDLIAMGYTTIASLRGKRAEELYAEECRLRGCLIDRCQLYLYRAVEYFVNAEIPTPTNANGGCGKMNLSNPRPAEPYVPNAATSLLHAADAGRFAARYSGSGIRTTMSAPSTNAAAKKKKNCGGCPELPCHRFMKDPTLTDEENNAHLNRMLERLQEAAKK